MQKFPAILFVFLVLYGFANGQGCSDAGFCSIRYHQQESKNEKQSISIGNVVGKGDGNTFINNSYVLYTRHFNKGISWDTKLTANYASGSLANHFNAGDVFTTASFPLFTEGATKILKLSSGLKIPLTSANDKAGVHPLPMAYQSSLGTYDLLLGLNLSLHQKWEFTQAWQIPLTRQNKNSYFSELGVTDAFPSTNLFNRKPDALFRVAYTHRIASDKVFLKPNLLAVYHTGTDNFINNIGNKTALTGSKGLTLNANLIAGFALSSKQSIEISLAAPLVVRTIRPDGLTRSFTAGIEYHFGW
ncbi:MAG TPA: hypothetical protein PKC39_06140 [Ferruginibacter sp.]|nr:hypothetical protein [Ferruginibacter sp.]HMP20522.1 hypothetical protein [Ferruginibacter sp.]